MGSIIIFSNIALLVFVRLTMPMDLLYSFVLAVFGFAIGFIGGQDEQGYSWNTPCNSRNQNPQSKIDFYIRILEL